MNTVLTAAVVALVVMLGGSLPWGFLGAANMRTGIAWPWAVMPMLLYLGLYWQVIRGRWPPPEQATRWRVLLRANPLPAHLWAPALGAGLLGFAALLALLAVMARVMTLPTSDPITTPDSMPFLTALALLAMQSLVAGVTEEAAFRGYMQSLIEPRYGLLIAILAHGTWFGLLHFSNHPADVVMMLPYYISVSAVYGGLTWATNSILPALVLHVVGDIAVLTRWWLTGLPEWQLSATAQPAIWHSGVDSAFVIALLLLTAFSATTALSLRWLGRQRSTDRIY